MQSLLKNKKLLIILLLGFVLRLGFFLINQPWQSEIEIKQVLLNDASGYHRLAQKILFEHNFQQDMFRTPVYPAIIAIIYAVFGVHPWIVLIIQVIASTLTILFFYRIALYFFNERTAIWSAFLFSTSSIYILHSGLLLTETFYLLFHLAAIYFFYRFLKEDKLKYVVICGVFTGIATLTRPSQQFYAFAFILLSILYYKFNPKKVLKLSFALLIPCYLVLLPWLIRNYNLDHHFQVSPVGKFNLLFFNCALSEAKNSGVSYEQVIKNQLTEIKKEEKPGISFPDSFANIWINVTFTQSDVYGKYATKYISEHPKTFFKDHIIGMIKTHFNIGIENIIFRLHVPSSFRMTEDQRYASGITSVAKTFFQKKSFMEILIAGIIGIHLILIYMFALFGSIRLFQEKQYVLLLFFTGSILYFLMLSGILAYSRFRIPFEIFYILLAGYGIDGLLKKRDLNLK